MSNYKTQYPAWDAAVQHITTLEIQVEKQAKQIAALTKLGDMLVWHVKRMHPGDYEVAAELDSYIDDINRAGE
jgi:hypothetical protein